MPDPAIPPRPPRPGGMRPRPHLAGGQNQAVRMQRQQARANRPRPGGNAMMAARSRAAAQGGEQTEGGAV